MCNFLPLQRNVGVTSTNFTPLVTSSSFIGSNKINSNQSRKLSSPSRDVVVNSSELTTLEKMEVKRRITEYVLTQLGQILVTKELKPGLVYRKSPGMWREGVTWQVDIKGPLNVYMWFCVFISSEWVDAKSHRKSRHLSIGLLTFKCEDVILPSIRIVLARGNYSSKNSIYAIEGSYL